MASVSDPNVVLDLRAKLEATGLFDRFEVDRVAKIAVKPKATQGELDAAITPVSLRLLTRFKAAKAASLVEPEGSRAFQAAKDEMAALVLFKGDLGTYARVYEFLGCQSALNSFQLIGPQGRTDCLVAAPNGCVGVGATDERCQSRPKPFGNSTA